MTTLLSIGEAPACFFQEKASDSHNFLLALMLTLVVWRTGFVCTKQSLRFYSGTILKEPLSSPLKTRHLVNRLMYRSTKCGILENDILLGSFAKKHLPFLSGEQLLEYESLLQENDLDIFRWITADDGNKGPTMSRSGALFSKDEAAPVVGLAPSSGAPDGHWAASFIVSLIRKHVAGRRDELSLGNRQQPCPEACLPSH